MVLFAASDTQFAGKGYRSMETAWIAQNAAISALNGLGLRPSEHIVNFDSEFVTPTFRPADAAGPIFIRPETGLREPQFFDTPEYVKHLLAKYGSAPDDPNRLSQQAWAAHERDAEQAVREALGAEGVYDILARTRKSLSRMRAYANSFHTACPDRRGRNNNRIRYEGIAIGTDDPKTQLFGLCNYNIAASRNLLYFLG
jgi:hypothetical protein